MGRVAKFGSRAQGALRAYGPAALPRWYAPPQRFVVLTVGRTGSELLRELLNSHPGVVCDGELLSVRPRFPRLYVEAAQVRARRAATEAYGWKELGGHLAHARGTTPRQFLIDLHNDGYRLILLERRDYLQQSISWYRVQFESFHYRKGELVEFAPAQIDPQLLLRAARENEESAERLRATVADLPHFRLTYEDDLRDPVDRVKTMDKLCDYIGISRQEMSSDIVKVTPHRTRDMVSNWDDVVTAFEDTRFVHLVADPA